MLNDSLYSSKKQDWNTPLSLFNKLNKEFNFTLDVCADDSNFKCKNYFDIHKNGLIQEWIGNCWMNPPYGREISKWIEKATLSIKNKECNIIVCLLPVRSDTKWWHNYVMKSSEIRFLNKRLTFDGANNKAPFPSCIVIFNKNLTLLISSMEI